jgi:hypothetical protein
MTPLRPNRAAVLVLVLLALMAIPAAAGEAGQRADEPWPVSMGYGACKKKTKNRAGVLAWTPPKAKRIRAVLLVMINTDSKIFAEHKAVRRVAAKHEMGVVYLRCPEVHYNLKEARDTKIILGILEKLAKTTGIEEFRHAPWITFGKSASGKFPFWMGWIYPKRTIASISYHAETPTWPVADWARLDGETILHTNVNGQSEWGRTWRRHVRPALLKYRTRGWLTNQVVVHKVGHGNYPDMHGSDGWGKKFPDRVTCIDVWDYLALFIDKALEARLPEKGYPTTAPLELVSVSDATGCLIEPRVEDLLNEDGNADGMIHKAAEAPANKRDGMFWVADRELAEAWFDLHAVHGQKLEK